jgi:hypothetical protein
MGTGTGAIGGVGVGTGSVGVVGGTGSGGVGVVGGTGSGGVGVMGGTGGTMTGSTGGTMGDKPMPTCMPGPAPTDPPAMDVPGIEFSEMSIYQVLKDQLMKGGADAPPPAAPMQKLPVVAGKDTMFRSFVTIGAGWAPRMMYARITLSNNTANNGAPLNVTKTTEEPTLGTSLQVDLLGCTVTPGTQYAISLHDASGAPLTSGGKPLRWPATGFKDLNVKDLGGAFKVTVCPYTMAGGKAVNVKKEDWENFARSVMPAGTIDIMVLPEIALPVEWSADPQYGGPIGNAFLGGITARRAAEEKDLTRFWYGVTNPVTPGGASGLGNVAGPGDMFSLSAVGDGAFVSGAGTGIHELGHALGQNHVSCMGEGGVDPAYPYPMCQIGPWGYSRAPNPILIDPKLTPDIMSYGFSKQPGWFFPFMSDYTYMAFWARLRLFYGTSAYALPANNSSDTYDMVATAGPDLAWWVGKITGHLIHDQTGTVTLLAADGTIAGTVEADWRATSDGVSGKWVIPASGAAAVLLPGSQTPVALSAAN